VNMVLSWRCYSQQVATALVGEWHLSAVQACGEPREASACGR